MWPFDTNRSEPGWFDSNSNARQTSSNVYDNPLNDSTATEPVTLDQAKNQCRIDFTDDDVFVTQLITACRRQIERFCGISIVSKQGSLTMDLIADMEIPYGPVIALTSFIDKDGNVISSGQYSVYGAQFKRIMPLGFKFYRSVLTYTAGYGTTPVPPDLCLAILQEIAFRYENRGEGQDTRKSVNPGICESAQLYAEPFKRFAWA